MLKRKNSPVESFNYDRSKNIEHEVSEIPASNLPSSCKVFPKKSIEEVKVKSLVTNVHVNPNFKPKNTTMHINPKIHAKPLIHINPKMMRDIANSNINLQNNVTCTTNSNITSNTVQTNIKRSIYVNPTLLKKLSSLKNKSANPKESFATEQSASLKLTTPVASIDNRKVSPKKASDTSVVLLSRRKLVRVAPAVHNVSGTSSVSRYRLRKSLDSTEKKSGTIAQRNVKVSPSASNTSRSVRSKCNLPKSSVGKSKMSRYKIDRTALHRASKVKGSPPKTRKAINNTVELVTIGGIVYRSSKNRLIRRSCSLKQKRSVNNEGNNEKSAVTNNAKKLRRSKENPNRALETNVSTKTRRSFNISLKTTHKNNISNKVKQRSIQILRNKMRKNNQPCLIFQRFGYCLNQKNGLCPKRHDKKQVSICKKFLQGKCFLDKCPLSHDVGPEKMPTCKYFLDGCCTRDACPYLHVKVSSSTSICIDFLQGYCAKGNECQRRHEYLCPEFDKSGNCNKGKYCPYPHKSHPPSAESTKYTSKKTHDEQKHQTTSVAKDDAEISNSESRLRYYERSDDLSGDFEKKKENILRKVEIMKTVLTNDLNVDLTKHIQIKETNEFSVKEDENKESKKPKESLNMKDKRRIPIGSLPAYIPID